MACAARMHRNKVILTIVAWCAAGNVPLLRGRLSASYVEFFRSSGCALRYRAPILLFPENCWNNNIPIRVMRNRWYRDVPRVRAHAQRIILNSMGYRCHRLRRRSFIVSSSFSRFGGPRRAACNYSLCFLSLLFPAVSYERHVRFYLDTSERWRRGTFESICRSCYFPFWRMTRRWFYLN